MIKKLVISLTSVSVVFIATSCGTRVDAPGDTAVETRTVEKDKKPGNILAEGRIKATGE
jgi:hypothetical protein